MSDSQSRVKRYASIVCILLSFATAGWGQKAAELAGAVADSTGSVIAGVQVVATNQGTGVRSSTISNEAGLYRISELTAGSYQIEASRQGFKTFVTNVVLESSRVTTVNVAMEVGELTQRVEIQALAPTLETQSQTVSNIVEQKLIQDLPVQIRRPLQLLVTAAAVTYNGTEPTTTQTPFYSLAGGKTVPALYIDGGNAQQARLGGNVHDINPTMEVTSEFRMVLNSYKAEYGGAGGGLLLMTTKSGTNDFHGTLWEFHRQRALDARNFFATTKTPFRENIFGGAVGGPIRKNKLHFFGSYERTINKITDLVGSGRGLTAEFFQTLPTIEQRTGDFSRTLNRDGSLRAIYDPYSTVVGPDGRATRAAFPGNIIPANRISPIARRALDLVPQPNRQPDDLTGTNNFVGVATNSTNRNALTTRIDYQHSTKDNFFYRLLFDNGPFQYDGPWPGNPEATRIRAVTGDLATRNPYDPQDAVLLAWSKNQMGSWTHIVTPQMITNVSFTYHSRQWGVHHASSGLGYPASLGLPLPTPIAKTTEKFGDPNDAMPNIIAAGYTLPGSGQWAAGEYQGPMRTFNFIESLTWLKGAHSFKIGSETRRSSNILYTHLGWPGNYNFANRGTAANPFDATSGNSVASLMLDWPDSGRLNSTALRHFVTWWNSGYFQDDWKVTKNFTLNLGVRYEVDLPVAEGISDSQCKTGFPPCKSRINGIDLNAINPVSGTPGAATFPKDNYWDVDGNNFAPRIGFAWNIGGGRTVVRGGGGMFYTYSVSAVSSRDYPAVLRPDVTTAVDVSTPDAGITAPYHLSTGLLAPPPFKSQDLNPGIGAVRVGETPKITPTFLDRSLIQGYSEMFNINIEHQLSNGLFFEAGWLANLGHHLPGNLSLNQVRPEKIGPSTTPRDRPFPQYNGLSQLNAPAFNSNYHALVIKAEKRFSSGLSFVANFTWAKFLDDTAQQNLYNRKINKGLSSDHRTGRFVFSGSYELPFGPGKRYATKGPLSYIVGGWNVAPQFIAQSGQPLTPIASPDLCNCFAAGSIRANRVPGSDTKGPRTIDNWFNVAAFTHPGAFTFGNAMRGSIIGPGFSNVDTSIAKNVSFRERYTLNIRVDMFNTFNHTQFGNPSVLIFPANSPGTTNIIRSSRDARRIQLGLRFLF